MSTAYVKTMATIREDVVEGVVVELVRGGALPVADELVALLVESKRRWYSSVYLRLVSGSERPTKSLSLRHSRRALARRCQSCVPAKVIPQPDWD